MNALIRPQERMDDLERNGLKIIQNPSMFCFGMDAILLADFAEIKPRDMVADMGTGTGILPVLMSQKEETAKFHAFEIQPEMAEMARRTMLLNGLEERVRVHAMDMRDASTFLGYESMDVVVCNPPYGKQGSALVSTQQPLLLARHETDFQLRDVVASCAAIVKNRGRLFMVLPAPRMLELCDALREKRLEPKRVRLVCAKPDREPYLVLMEAIKNAKPSLKWLPPLMVYHQDGTETEELKRIYHRE